RLGERAAISGEPLEYEPSGAVHLHALSVGEAMLALKLIRAWREREPERRFVQATGTATGHAVATGAGIPGLRVTYAPLDFPSMVRRYLDRFEPERIVLVEGEAWPHLMIGCRRRGIPVALVNARMSPRSARRYRKCAAWLRPLFCMLDAVAVQETEDAEVWKLLGVEPERIHHTGSLKFDPAGGALPAKRDEFQKMIDAFGKNRRVVLAASTHPGEDAWIATAIREAAPDALPVIVPRHAERRDEVRAELEQAGFEVVLRSHFGAAATGDRRHVLVVDSTGELRDWTAHADVVVIGKSFLATGGQNPAEAILARKPLVCGPHMENFEPLASRLVASGGCLIAENQDQLRDAIRQALDPANAEAMCGNASKVLATHEGATRRILDLLDNRFPA
ncbi:MAG TPA: glycosyltransferase N-terminal domain-containing protein, partial [Luteolibacter sp.]|nr:glycosyltransferase N-terminal domain-containing protein [Luteolibacter sp.]